MTKKLYDENSRLTLFQAVVLDCRQSQNGYDILLDQTAFFPEGGGQASDSGTLNGVAVDRVEEKDGSIFHHAASPIPKGTAVCGQIDWEKRFDRMQNHTGEHILSGIIHRLYHLDNVGFHLGEWEVTVDFNGPLTREQLEQAEAEANEAVTRNIPVKAWYPVPEELKKLDYRSKLELTENVRIVQIGDVDLCACCAPHVELTGEIGLIKVLDSERYKGGTRVNLLCGKRAVADYQIRYRNTAEIAGMLSAKQEEAALAVSRILEENAALRQQVNLLQKELAEQKADALPDMPGNFILFDSILDKNQARLLVNKAVKRCGGIFAFFSGSDKTGYTYIMASETVDLRQKAKEINLALRGKGGGSPAMIQGSVLASRKEIENYLLP